MFIKKKIFIFLITFLFLNFATVTFAHADSYTLSGTVKDSSGNALVGATVSINDANNSSTLTNTSGNYTLLALQGIYDVQVTPPAGSGFSPVVALSQNINIDKTLDFVLVSAGQTNLSGHVYDPLGNGVANQKVSLWSPQGLKVVEATTDTSGTYTLPPVSPATDYKLQVEKEGNPSSINLPTDYLSNAP